MAALLVRVDESGHDVIRSSLDLIQHRGFDREKDLEALYRRAVRADALGDAES